MRNLNDTKYIENLAKATKSDPENLSPILGLDEFKEILTKLKPENFDPKSPEYCANFHTHTIYSDGKATPEDILNEAQQRAEKSGKMFYVGINDHDTLNSAREIVKIVAKNPEKYSKIKIEIGVEPCFIYENKSILKEPIPFDCLIYCVNPFDEITTELFEGYTQKNIECAKKVFEQANKKWGINANYKDSCAFHCLLKTGGSSGYFKFSRIYIENLLAQANLDVKREA